MRPTVSGFAHTAPADQADGLRRLFGGHALRALALVANPHVVWSGVAVERLMQAFVHLGRNGLIVDAADTSPAVAEAATLGLAGCIETQHASVHYLAARGLPRRFVDTRGSAGRLIEALSDAAPQCDALLLHATPTDLARIFKDRPLRPLLLASDKPESLKHAYAAWKLLVQRCGCLTADLMLLTETRSAPPAAVAASLSNCADQFMGAVIGTWAALDPLAQAEARPPQPLLQLAAAQLDPDEPTAFFPDTEEAQASSVSGMPYSDHRAGWPAAA